MEKETFPTFECKQPVFASFRDNDHAFLKYNQN